MKQLLSALLVRLGLVATRPVAARLEQLAVRVDRMAPPLDDVAGRLDHMAGRLDRTGDRLDEMADRLKGVEASLVALHRAVEELGAIPALSTELVDGIAEAEARAAARLADVERLLAGH